MLKLRREKHLASRLNTNLDELFTVIEHADDYREELDLYDPKRPGKIRRVLNILGKLRQLQNRVHDRLLVPALRQSFYSHGCVKGRSIKTNLTPHLNNPFVLTADISNFFPSIHHSRVYRLFVGRLMCSPDVARILTRLCTYKHHLALGLITSPMLANETLRPVDDRLGTMCGDLRLSYTRYVDDITISGPFDFSDSGIPKLIMSILEEHGLILNPTKTHMGRASDPELIITGVQIRNGHADVPRAYVEETVRQIRDAGNLSQGDVFVGTYYTETQILGRVRFICWVNPGWKKRLKSLFHSVNWDLAAIEATKRGLVQRRPILNRVIAS